MKSKFQLALLCGILSLFVLACNAPAAKSVDLEKVKTEIQAMEDAYAAAEKAKDAAAVVAYYSDDAVSYHQNEEPSVGKDAIKARLEKRFASDNTGNTNVYKVVDLFGEGNMLVEIGSYTTYNPSGEEVEKGHYMSYLQKKDGKYVCVRDMSANTKPAK
jgi:uncharacterized protein (TIGR02246 family)